MELQHSLPSRAYWSRKRDTLCRYISSTLRATKQFKNRIGILIIAACVASPSYASLDVQVIETGKIYFSADGAGTNASSGVTIQVDKPNNNATVRSAFLTCASTLSSSLTDGEVQLNGTPINWDKTVFNSAFTNVFSDVTTIIGATINAAPPGLVDFTQTETSTFSVDGCALYVIFDDPEQATDNTVFILFGGQATTGDSFAIALAEPLKPSDSAEFGLAISFSAQDQSGLGGSNLCGEDSGMFSTVDVNDQRLTSCSGNLDDGEGLVADGLLITVGGIGDDPANPVDPFQQAADGSLPRIIDDELYNLASFLDETEVSVVVDTLNPSDDDNIFAGHFLITTPAIIGEGIVLSPTSSINPVGTSHSATATTQDDNGIPIVGAEITIEVISGPNTGTNISELSDENGQATLTYTGNIVGIDEIQASFTNSSGELQTSNVVIKEWVIASCDVDSSGQVDINDINAIMARRNMPATGPDDPADNDNNGTIDANDARQCVLQCTNPECAI